MTNNLDFDAIALDYFSNDDDALGLLQERKRDEILETARQLINGPRAHDYGDARENFQRIANGWNIIIEAALEKDGEITTAHVGLMMDWVKTSRLLETINHEDSWVDKAAYSALGAEMAKDM